jgi:hypothetical protein
MRGAAAGAEGAGVAAGAGAAAGGAGDWAPAGATVGDGAAAGAVDGPNCPGSITGGRGSAGRAPGCGKTPPRGISAAGGGTAEMAGPLRSGDAWASCFAFRSATGSGDIAARAVSDAPVEVAVRAADAAVAGRPATEGGGGSFARMVTTGGTSCGDAFPAL